MSRVQAGVLSVTTERQLGKVKSGSPGVRKCCFGDDLGAPGCVATVLGYFPEYMGA